MTAKPPRCRHPESLVEQEEGGGDRCTRCSAFRPAGADRWRGAGLPHRPRNVSVVIRLSDDEAEALDALLARTGETRGAFVARVVASETTT